jgi:hypothetical protein
MSIGSNDVDGPAIAFVAPQNDDGSGGVLPFLRLGLLKDRKPYVRIVDKNGQTQFLAPAGNN